MDVDDIKELVRIMGKAGLKKLAIKRKDGSEIQLEKASSDVPAPAHPHSYYPPSPLQPAPAGSHVVSEPVLVEDTKGLHIEAPLVGTFYSKPNPGAEPYVQVGSKVTKDTIVCVIEAMKVMNEVKAGVNGVISKIELKDGSPVGYGMPLFTVLPE